MKKYLLLTSTLILAAAAAAKAATGFAKIQGTSPTSTVSGTVSFEDTKDGLKISAKLAGLTPGPHGFHIHEFGNCDDSGKAAGGHFNPKDSQHGFLPKDGMRHAHAGDMGNIIAAADGTATLDLIMPKVTLGGNFSVGGRAVIIHEKQDDFSQPVGNAGSRVGCGLIVISGK